MVLIYPAWSEAGPEVVGRGDGKERVPSAAHAGTSQTNTKKGVTQ